MKIKGNRTFDVGETVRAYCLQRLLSTLDHMYYTYTYTFTFVYICSGTATSSGCINAAWREWYTFMVRASNPIRQLKIELSHKINRITIYHCVRLAFHHFPTCIWYAYICTLQMNKWIIQMGQNNNNRVSTSMTWRLEQISKHNIWYELQFSIFWFSILAERMFCVKRFRFLVRFNSYSMKKCFAFHMQTQKLIKATIFHYLLRSQRLHAMLVFRTIESFCVHVLARAISSKEIHGYCSNCRSTCIASE